MAIKKKLVNIMVSPSINQVGITFAFEEGPSDHYLLPLKLAVQLKDRIQQACDLSAKYTQRPAGDSVGVSEGVSMSFIGPSKEH